MTIARNGSGQGCREVGRYSAIQIETNALIEKKSDDTAVKLLLGHA